MQVIGFYSPDWHVMLRCSHRGVLQLAHKVDAKHGSTTFPLRVPPHVQLERYALFLESVEVHACDDDRRVKMEVRDRAIHIEGAPHHLRRLAGQIRDVAQQAESPRPLQGFHVHIEPLAGRVQHPFLNPDSFPLIVAYYTPQESADVFVDEERQ